jgi:two-component system response regulator PilR (NtrC family)
VRELENIIERALALCQEGIITPADLQLMPTQQAPIESKAGDTGKYPLTDYLDRIEREAILGALHQTHFNRTAAAKILGVTFRALRYRMERLSITDEDNVD